MPDAVLFICDHCVEIHIGNTLEDICLDLRVCLFQGGDQLFRLKTLGRGGAILMAGGAGVGKMAGTLQKVQFVPFPPFADVRFPTRRRSIKRDFP